MRRILLCLIVLVALFGFQSSASADMARTIKFHKLSDFYNSVGVVTHPDYGPGTPTTGNSYQLFYPTFSNDGITAPSNYSWKKWACDSGIKLMRGPIKGVPFGREYFGNGQINDLYESCGIKWVLGLGDPNTYKSALAALENGSVDRGAVAALEMTNEIDGCGWGRPAIAGMAKGVRDWLNSHEDFIDVPLIGPSVTSAQAADCIGDLSDWIDYSNIHPYSATLPEDTISYNLANIASQMCPGCPAYATEGGYHTAAPAEPPMGVKTESEQATYATRFFANNFARGIKASMWYELLDEYPDPNKTNGENFFGLIRRDFTPKPAFSAINGMLGWFNTQSDEWPRVTGEVRATTDGPIKLVAFRRPDKRMTVLLWRPVPAGTAPTTVTLKVKRTDWPWGMYVGRYLPSENRYIGADPSPPNDNGWRTWTFSVDSNLQILDIWY